MSDAESGVVDEAVLARITRQFFEQVPHNTALGIEILELERSRARFALPYQEALVGDPERGILHGGVITTLMDTACGCAAFMALTRPMALATLDLRIDYLRKAEPYQAVHADAFCYKMTRNVAFVRGSAYHRLADDPVATATGTFMVATRSGQTAQSETP